MVNAEDAARALTKACAIAGLHCDGFSLLRTSENSLFILPNGVVARVTRTGQGAVAQKEVNVARWLRSVAFPVVEIVDIDQPVIADGRAVTFWKQLPPHRSGTAADVSQLLKRLHVLPVPPTLELPKLNPFTRLMERVQDSTVLSEAGSAWLKARIEELETRWLDLPTGRPWSAVHGDAWGSNFVVTADHVVMLDLERFAFGPPEWDLAAIAVDHETFGSVSAEEWQAVCDGYGLDVISWPGYKTLRDIRELRKVTFAFQIAEDWPGALTQASYRLACIQGERGSRPWNWVGVV
jgi:hypothetical protein